MNTKKGALYRPYIKGFVIFLIVSALGLGSYYFFFRKETAQEPSLVNQDLLSLPIHPWAEDPTDGKRIVKPYTRKGKGKEGVFDTISVYDITGTDGKVKRTTTWREGDQVTKEVVDYFVIRPIYQEDARFIHALVRDSGKEHFGYEPTFEDYSKSEDQALLKTMQLNHSSSRKPCVVLYSKDNENFSIIGSVDCSSLQDRYQFNDDEHGFKEKQKIALLSYSFGHPKVTGVRGVAESVVYAYQAQLFHFEEWDEIWMHVQKDNEKSLNVGRRLHMQEFTNPRFNSLPYGGEGREQRNMVLFRKTRAVWEKEHQMAPSE